MTETIESFVAKLKTEGVEAGQKQAEQLKQEAQQEADRVVAQARQDAEKIVADAQAEAEKILARGRTELELAARDATLKLRESLVRALEGVLNAAVREPLNDVEMLKQLLDAIVMRYVDADIKGVGAVKIDLAPELSHQLADWAIAKVHSAIDCKGCSVDLKSTLRQAGFEFNITGATVEVTQESVVDTLKGLVSPKLRDLFDKAAAGRGDKGDD